MPSICLDGCRGTPRAWGHVGAQGCAGHGSEASLSKPHSAEARADHYLAEKWISHLTGWAVATLKATGAEAVVRSLGHAPVAQSTWTGGKGLVRPWLCTSDGSKHSAQVTSCMQVWPRTSTARDSPHRTAKVQEEQHCARAQSCEDREFFAEKRRSPNTLSCKRELQPRERPDLWQHQAHHRPFLSPGHTIEVL